MRRKIDEETGMVVVPEDETDSSKLTETMPPEGVVVVSEEEMSDMLEEAETQETTDWTQ